MSEFETFTRESLASRLVLATASWDLRSGCRGFAAGATRLYTLSLQLPPGFLILVLLANFKSLPKVTLFLSTCNE